MVKVKEDLTGSRFGRLTVISQAEDYISKSGKHRALWKCQCDCGNIVNVRTDNLKSGIAKSCGCLQKEKAVDCGKQKKKYNKYDLTGEYGIGWASNTNEEFYFDLEDYDKIKNYCWRVGKRGYLVTNNKTQIKFHSIIGCKYHDHINKNKLDNRKANLREATQQQNIQNKSKQKNNKSGIIGVYQNKESWVAEIKKDKKYSKTFKTKEEAIIQRLKWEQELFGQFAPQQELFEQYGIAIKEE